MHDCVFRRQIEIMFLIQCDSARALELFNTSITSNGSVVAIVGCGCSLATEEIASRSDIPVVSYGIHVYIIGI